MPTKKPSTSIPRSRPARTARPELPPPAVTRRLVSRSRPLLRRHGALLAIVGIVAALGGWSVWQPRFRQQPVASAVPTAAGARAADIEPAEQSLREAVRLHPRDGEALQKLAFYLLERRRPYEAMELLQDTLERQPGDPEIRAALAQALVMARLPRRALAFLGRESGSRPKEKGDVPGSRMAAAAYLAMGNAAGAVAALQSAGPTLETSASALLDLGTAHEALGDDDAAASVYRRHLRMTPDSLRGELALARVAVRRRQWEEALAALNRARRLAPDDPRPPYQLALALQAQDSSRTAPSTIQNPKSKIHNQNRFFHQVLASHPGYGPAHFRMGLWHQRRRRPVDAAASFEAAIAAGAGGDEVHLLLAEALDQAGRRAAACYQRGVYYLDTHQPHRAVREYQRMARLDPSRADAFLMLSTAFTQMKEKARAAEAVRQGLERHPDDPQLLARRGMLLLMLYDRPAAAQFCRRWLERHPEAAEPYRLLGRIARDELRFDEAIRLCEQAMSRSPKNADYCLDAARALKAAPTAANLERAVAVLRQAVALNPRDAEAPLLLGHLLQRRGDLDGAREQFQRSMDRDPTRRDGAYALVQLCLRQGKDARSGFFAEIVRDLHQRENEEELLWRRIYQLPRDPDAHARMARLLMEAGDLRQARRQLRQTLALQPDRPAEQRRLRIVERILALRER